MATQTTINTPAAVNEWFDRKLLYTARQAQVYSKVAEKRPLKNRNGKIIVFRRFEAMDLDPALAPLVEGIPPAAQSVDHTDINAEIQPYGAFVQHTDLHEYTVDSPIVNEYAERLGQQAGEVLDKLIALEAVTGSNVVYGGNAANRAALDATAEKITPAVLDQIIRALSDANALRYTPAIPATDKISTFGVHRGFWGIIHPDVYFSIREIAGWKDTIEYASQATIVPNEVGAYRDIRFLMSTLAPVILGGGGATGADIKSTGGVADVYQTIICGRHSLATIPLDGHSLRMITKKLGSAGAADPLDMISTQGWKTFSAWRILNDAFMYRLETVAGLNAP